MIRVTNDGDEPVQVRLDAMSLDGRRSYTGNVVTLAAGGVLQMNFDPATDGVEESFSGGVRGRTYTFKEIAGVVAAVLEEWPGMDGHKYLNHLLAKLAVAVTKEEWAAWQEQNRRAGLSSYIGGVTVPWEPSVAEVAVTNGRTSWGSGKLLILSLDKDRKTVEKPRKSSTWMSPPRHYSPDGRESLCGLTNPEGTMSWSRVADAVDCPRCVEQMTIPEDDVEVVEEVTVQPPKPMGTIQAPRVPPMPVHASSDGRSMLCDVYNYSTGSDIDARALSWSRSIAAVTCPTCLEYLQASDFSQETSRDGLRRCEKCQALDGTDHQRWCPQRE